MLILGINCSLANAEVAILKNDQIIAMEKDHNAFSQASSIAILIEAAAKKAAIDFKDIDALACTIGPGSFTGIRIGLAAAKGLEIALGKPLFGINVFEAAAMNYGGKEISVLVDSRRDDFFRQDFNTAGIPLAAPSIIAREEIEQISEKTVFADKEDGLVENACRLAKLKFEAGQEAPAAPMYIRAADVTVCKK